VSIDKRSCSTSGRSDLTCAQKRPSNFTGPPFLRRTKANRLLLLFGRLVSGLWRIGLVLLLVARRVGLLVAGRGFWSIGHRNSLS
jgi:hypothetical protein